MNPEQLMTATDEEIQEYENSLLNESPEEVEDSLHETPEETPESVVVEEPKETTTEDSEELEPIPPHAIMSMSDEEFESYVAENENPEYVPSDDYTKAEDIPPSEIPQEDSDPVPTIEELREKVLRAEELLEQNKALNENRELVEALDVNGLLSPDKVNQLIGVAKGDKKAILTLLEANGIDIGSLKEETTKPKKDEKVSKKGTGTDDSEDPDDLFDSWLNGDDDEESESKPSKTDKEEKEEEKTEEPELQEIDYLDQIATNKVGAVASEILTTYGQEVLDAIDDHIDVPSFEMLKRSPEDLKALAEQKQNGVMDMINDQINQMESKGIFPPNIPYLTKYRLAGNLLIEQAKEPAKPIDRKVKTSSTTVDPKLLHSQSVTSSTSPSSDKPTTDPYNIFTMSDEEFNKIK